MIRCAAALLCLLLFASTGTSAPLLGLVPAPASVALGHGWYSLQSVTRILCTDPQALAVANYAHLLLRELAESEVGQVAPGSRPRAAIVLELQPTGGNPESYVLDVSPERILITATDVRGLRYGVVTLWQLLSAAPLQKRIPVLHISDAPRFRWRGLLLDSARHYQSPQFIERLIDQMALHKLNVLHWHLTDDQAWRIQIKRYPRLTEVGAWREPAGAGSSQRYGGYYSQQQVRDIVARAAQRGITVVPEIEMPGHASAAIVAYPQLGVDPLKLTAVPADWGVYANLFNVEESTFEFLENVLDEVLSLFPSEYIHVGGDEAVKDQWRASAAVQRRMRELGVPDEHALQSYFIQRIGKFLERRGRRLIGWDEILEGGLAPNATVMSWRGLDGAIAAAAADHDTVLAPWPTLYLDNRNSDSPAEPPGRGRVVSLRDIYSFDPAPPGLEGVQPHILGIQANLWTEHIRTEARVEHMVFPRIAALAEVAWSPAARSSWEDFARRMTVQELRYQRESLHYARVDGMTQPVQHPRSRQSRSSHELQLCSEKLVLALEDDAPLDGERAVFLVDITNPCWIFPDVALTQLVSLRIDVGQVPFNFQIGAEAANIALDPAATPPALEVFRGSCSGERLARVPLTPALGSNGVTRLPPIRIAASAEPNASQPAMQDLCFRFARAQLDPMWVIERVQLESRSAH